MKSITVYPQDIVPNTKYICDKDGRCDLVGQILMNGYGIRIPVKTRTPQCLQTGIIHFVDIVRQYVYCNTPLTLKLLHNSSLPPRKQIAAANELLQSINVILVSEDQLTMERIQQPQMLGTSYHVRISNVPRLSRVHCVCGQSSAITNLIQDDETEYSCSYCLKSLPLEIVKQFIHLL